MTETSVHKKGRVGRIIYTILLLIFAAVLIMIAYIILADWQNYLVAYENSQPDAVIEEYMENLKETKWKQMVHESASDMYHPFQSDEECEAIQAYIDEHYDVDVDLEDGGQPVYSFLIGAA